MARVQTAALGGINSKRVEKGKKAESSNGPWVHGLVIGYGHGSSSCFNKSFCCVEKQTTPLPFPLSHVPFSLSLHPHRKTHEPCRKIHQLAGKFKLINSIFIEIDTKIDNFLTTVNIP
jgi:hypothetical protein